MATPNRSGLPYYVPGIDRHETENILKIKKDGVFLIRDSKTIVGDKVLSVSENKKVSHYIINNKGSHYQIGENTFETIPDIVDFYKRHLLETTTLVESAVVEPPCNIKVVAMFNFAGNDAEDLPFRRGDILTIIDKPEDKWWKAQDSKGKQGLIPTPYIKLLDEEQAPEIQSPVPAPARPSPQIPSEQRTPQRNTRPCANGPILARAIQTRVEPYDPSQLPLTIGEFIEVLQKNENGTWYGRKVKEDSDGKRREGYFPFKFVKEVDQNNPDEINGL